MKYLAVLLLALALPARAALDETVIRVPVGAERAQIEVTIYKPAGKGPFPVAILSHGSPRTPAERRSNGRQRLTGQSQRFVDMGFAVVVPTRRGYGASEGEFAENFGKCNDPDYRAAGLETARDIRAAADAIRAEPWADARRIVLVGQSAGGLGSIAAASAPFEGAVAVVNFAGGRGSRGPDEVCNEGRLVETMAAFGATSKLPELWIYSTNDHYFGPALAQRMHAAFVKAGGKAEFIEAPASGNDGHAYFARSPDDWAPRVVQFLDNMGVKR
jgi:dienelactone hydrolase